MASQCETRVKNLPSILSIKKIDSREDLCAYDGIPDASGNVLELPTVNENVDHQEKNVDHQEKNVDHQEKNVRHPEVKKSGFRMVYLAAMASMLSAVSSGYSSVYSGPATFDMQTRNSSSIKVTDDEVSWIGSVLPMGVVFGIPLAVYLTDRIGRKETLIFNAIPFTVSWLIIIYAPNPFFLMVGRFIGGWPLAIVYTVLPSYAVEISSADTRGLIGASFQASVTIGSLLSMGLGAVLMWSWLAVGGFILVIIALIAFCPLPESPRWLIAHGMKEKAIEAIQFLHGDKIDAEKECQIIESSIKMQTKSKFSIENFKQPIVYKPALISFVQMFFIPFSGSVVIVMFTSLIAEQANSVLESKYATVVVGATQAIATVFSTLIVDRAGRRVLLLLSGFFMGISLGALGTYFYISTYDKTVFTRLGWLPITCLVLYIAMFSIGFGPVPYLMLSEMVPTRERGFISGIATFIMSGLAFVVGKTFEDLKKVIDYHGVFWTYTAFCFLSCFFVYFFVPETKGKQLEEIQLIFTGQQKSVVNARGRVMEKGSEDGITNPAYSER